MTSYDIIVRALHGYASLRRRIFGGFWQMINLYLQ